MTHFDFSVYDCLRSRLRASLFLLVEMNSAFEISIELKYNLSLIPISLQYYFNTNYFNSIEKNSMAMFCDHWFRQRKAFLLIYSFPCQFNRVLIYFDPSLFGRKFRLNEEMSEVYPKDDEY